MQHTNPKLYKLDSKGKTRVWYMEQDGDRYRTFDGIYGGTVKPSGWRTAKPTNVGRSNERGPVSQAIFEIEASYTKQLKGAYYEDIADIHLGCRYIEPMLLEKYTTFKPGEVQPKLDGFRCLIKADGGWSREGEILPGANHIVAMLHERGIFTKVPGLILDGELYNHDLKSDFGGLSSLIKKGNPTPAELERVVTTVQLHAYDVISMAGKPRQQRRKALAGLVGLLDHSFIQLVPSHDVETEEQYDELHIGFVGDGWEGSVWKDHDALYDIGKRSKAALKRKDFDEEEFEIVRIEEGEGNWAGAAKRVVCWLPGAYRTCGPHEDNTFEAGLRGKKPANVALLAEADQHKVVSIRFFGWTTTAIPKPRFGVATKFWGAERTL